MSRYRFCHGFGGEFIQDISSATIDGAMVQAKRLSKDGIAPRIVVYDTSETTRFYARGMFVKDVGWKWLEVCRKCNGKGTIKMWNVGVMINGLTSSTVTDAPCTLCHGEMLCEAESPI